MAYRGVHENPNFPKNGIHSNESFWTANGNQMGMGRADCMYVKSSVFAHQIDEHSTEFTYTILAFITENKESEHLIFREFHVR